MERTADDVRAGGPAWTALRDHASTDVADPLRLLGSVHRLALQGAVPRLARYYPSAGGSLESGDPWPAFREVLEEHADAVIEGMSRPVQTNEVGRCAALLGGFQLIAEETRLPMALAEIGASAGLNLTWDRYCYRSGGESWGDPDSPVRFDEPFPAGKPPRSARAEVVDRAGCDLRPVDPT